MDLFVPGTDPAAQGPECYSAVTLVVSLRLRPIVSKFEPAREILQKILRVFFKQLCHISQNGHYSLHVEDDVKENRVPGCFE